MMLRCLLFVLLADALLFVAPARAETVTIFAAASLKTALDQIVEGQDTAISYAASSTIARQVELGAPADIVMTANDAWMTYLEQQERILPDTRLGLLGNELVLITAANTALTEDPWETHLADARIAMALVDAVPAGIYGKEALTSLGLWHHVQANVVQTDNVRAALRLVAAGQVPLGIVYASDARAEPRVQIMHSFDTAHHQEITYPMAIVAGKDRPAVRRLWAHLQSAEAADIFHAEGFTVKAQTP